MTKNFNIKNFILMTIISLTICGLVIGALVLHNSNKTTKETDDIVVETLQNTVTIAKGFSASNYTIETFDHLSENILKADQALNKIPLVQADIDIALSALNTAIRQLDLKGNSSKLILLMQELEKLNNEIYTPETMTLLEAQLLDTTIMLGSIEDLGQSVLNQIVLELEDLRDKLVFRGNKSVLEELIKSAQAFVSFDYENESFIALEASKTQAKLVAENDNADQATVDEMIKGLQLAIFSLDAVPYTAEERLLWVKNLIINTNKFPQEKEIKDFIAQANSRAIQNVSLRTLVDLSTEVIYGITPGTLLTREPIIDIFHDSSVMQGELYELHNIFQLINQKTDVILEMNKWYTLPLVLQDSSLIIKQVGAIVSEHTTENVRLTYEHGIITLETMITFSDEITAELSENYEYYIFKLNLREEYPIFTFERVINFEGNSGIHNNTYHYEHNQKNNYFLIDSSLEYDSSYVNYYIGNAKVSMGIDETNGIFYDTLYYRNRGYSQELLHNVNRLDEKYDLNVHLMLNGNFTAYVYQHVSHDGLVDMGHAYDSYFQYNDIQENYVLPLYLFDGFTKYETKTPSTVTLYSKVDDEDVAFPLEFHSLKRGLNVIDFYISRWAIEEFGGFEVFKKALVDHNIVASPSVEKIYKSSKRVSFSDKIDVVLSAISGNEVKVGLRDIKEVMALFNSVKTVVQTSLGNQNKGYDYARSIFKDMLLELNRTL